MATAKSKNLFLTVSALEVIFALLTVFNWTAGFIVMATSNILGSNGYITVLWSGIFCILPAFLLSVITIIFNVKHCFVTKKIAVTVLISNMVTAVLSTLIFVSTALCFIPLAITLPVQIKFCTELSKARKGEIEEVI